MASADETNPQEQICHAMLVTTSPEINPGTTTTSYRSTPIFLATIPANRRLLTTRVQSFTAHATRAFSQRLRSGVSSAPSRVTE
jgi:hypothetical protein